MPTLSLRRSLALFFATATVAAAQVPGGATTANPAVATQRVEKIATPPPVRPASVNPSMVTTGVAIEGANSGDETRVFVKQIVFEGAEQLPQDKLAKLAAVVEGREVTLGQLNVLARRVRLLARQQGLMVATVRVPPQEITSGTVRLVMLEGRYGRLRVQGAKSYPEAFVREFFSPAMDKKKVTSRELYRSLLLLNEYPDLAVQAQFAAGRTLGETDVVLAVKDADPVHAAIDYNNFGSRLVGRNRLGASAFLGNFFSYGDEMLLRAVDSWPGRSHIFTNAAYTRPINRHGTKLSMQYANAETHVRGRGLSALDIRGDAKIYSLVGTYPYTRTFTVVQNVSLAFSAKTVKNFFFGDTLTSQDDLRTLSLATDGAIGDRLGRWIYTVAATAGLHELFNGKPNSAPLGSRVGAGNDFSKLNVDVLRNLDLKKDRFLLLRFSGQVSTDPLVTAEQFGVGGPDSVRGFIQSEALGDEGFNLSAEYRHQLHRSKDGSRVLQGVGFLDYGHVELKRPQVAERRERSLTGYGVGVRAAVKKVTVRADLGLPLSQGRNADGDDVILYAQASTRF